VSYSASKSGDWEAHSFGYPQDAAKLLLVEEAERLELWRFKMGNTKCRKSKARNPGSNPSGAVSDIVLRLREQVLICVSLEYLSINQAMKLIVISDDDEAMRARDKLSRRVDRIQKRDFRVRRAYYAAQRNEVAVPDVGGKVGSDAGAQLGNQAGAGA